MQKIIFIFSLIQRTPQKESYYPMEVLKIVEGQRVPIDKQTPNLTEQMIRQCQVLPVNLPEQIHKQKVAAKAQNENRFFRANGIKIESELIRSNAQLLHLPAIQYTNNDTVEPDQNRGCELKEIVWCLPSSDNYLKHLVSNWRMIGRDVNPRRRFLDAATFPKTWVVAIVQNCVPMDACQRFCKLFAETAVNRGLTDCALPPRVDEFEQTDM
jgi:hypothetical protein